VSDLHICREAGKERGPHREGAAQRQEEAAGLRPRGEHRSAIYLVPAGHACT
jgi:hypothetical protein